MACSPNRMVLLALACIVLTSGCQSSPRPDTGPFGNQVDLPSARDQDNTINQRGLTPSSSFESTWSIHDKGGDISAGPSAEPCVPRWIKPVEAEIVDRFRRPNNEYSAGNRGLEFGTVGGEPVVAIQAGEVVFAGPVGGNRFVVIRHVDGLKLTYAYLADNEVFAGETVSQGELLGHASTGFHLTVRDSGRYLDPQPFLDQCNSLVRLVPLSSRR